MTVAVDVTSGNHTASAVTSITWTHTPSGTPTAVGVTTYGFATATTDTASATYGGTTMGQTAHTSDTTPDIGYIFGLANPPSGAQTIIITFANTNYPCASSCTVTGSDTTTCFSNTAVNSGSASKPTVTCTSAAGELVLATGGADGSGAVTDDTGSSQTSYSNMTNGGEAAAASTAPGASSVTCTYSSQISGWVAIAASFKAASGGGDTLFIAGGLHFI